MRKFIEIFDRHFFKLHLFSLKFVELIPQEKLFWTPGKLNKTYLMYSCGENILRSAGKVEQAFGGITAKLWDDPFEWTLPETISSKNAVLDYLTEVERQRLKGFEFFTTDEDLQKVIPAPETLRSIFEVLLETIAGAEHFQGRAFSIFQMFSDEKLPDKVNRKF